VNANTLLGLVAFAASLGPGYIYLRVAERREPRQDRSQLLEAAELVVIGGLASSVAALLVLSLGDKVGVLETNQFSNEGWKYVSTHPTRALGSFLAFLVISYGGAWLAALVIHQARPASFERTSMWHQVFKLASSTNRAFATVELRDKRVVSGYVFAYSSLPTEPGMAEIALHAPIKAKAPNAGAATLLRDRFFVIRAEEIVYLAVQYQALPASSVT
jgi:Family of unknown function (DUF6338)